MEKDISAIMSVATEAAPAGANVHIPLVPAPTAAVEAVLAGTNALTLLALVRKAVAEGAT